jgi:serine/threonine protein kinase
LTDKKCALKVVKDDPDVAAEVASIQAICRPSHGNPHPHIIRVYEFLFREDLFTRQTIIQMEFCNGTLREYLDHMRRYHMSVSPIEIVNIMIQILTGLEHCHARDFCHRDLKLANSMSLDSTCD